MIFAACVTGFLVLMFLTTSQLSVMIDRVFPMAVASFAAIGGLLLLVQM